MSRFTAACRMVVVGAGMTAAFFIHLGALCRNFARFMIVASQEVSCSYASWSMMATIGSPCLNSTAPMTSYE